MFGLRTLRLVLLSIEEIFRSQIQVEYLWWPSRLFSATM